MRVIQVSKVQMNEIFVADGFRWAFLAASTKTGAQVYQRKSPFEDALGYWKNTQDPDLGSRVCPDCQTMRCPDGCCCGC